MRILLIGVGALVLGLGGGAYVSGSRAAGPLVEELKTARADSLAALGEDTHGAEDEGHAADDGSEEASDDHVDGADLEADQGEGDAAAPSDARVPAAGATDAGGHEADGEPVSSVPPPSRDEAPAGSEDVGTTPVAGAARQGNEASRGAVVAPDPEASRKLARIFGAMRPGDAAAVLTEMTNAEVEAILLTLSERQAAAILGNFEPDRAAGLSRAVLGLARGGT